MSEVWTHKAALALCAFALGLLIVAPAHGAPPTTPETTIDSGPPATTTSTSATFTFSSNVANATFECSLDGARFARCTSPHTYAGLAPGGHNFQVRAVGKGNKVDPTPATWTWTVGSSPPDTVPPETSIDSGPPSTTTSTGATFTFSSNEAGSTFQCALDGAAFAACTSPRSYSGLANGQHSFEVRATDVAGNTDPTPARYTWTIQVAGVQVSCGEALTRSTTVGNDLVDCLGDGLVVGSDNITIDLNGHTIDGVGLGAGVRNDGFSFVNVRNGTLQEFDHGVLLGPGTQINVVEDLTAQANQVAGVELAGAGESNRVRDNTLLANGVGVSLIDGSTGNTVSGNAVSGGGNMGIVLVASSGNTLLTNTVSGTGDGAIDLSQASNSNRIEGNVAAASGDAGITVADSDGNQLLSNTSRENSDAGIGLSAATGGAVIGNDLRFNPTGLELQASTGVRIEANNASSATGGGIELEGGSIGNDLLSNIANGNGANGIYVASEALGVPGNLLDGNTASGNGEDGIHVAEGGHTIRGNTANSNFGWGIFAELGNTDGGGNRASGNGQPEQCFGVRCGN
jgi:parallel beta-helix repeat protein